MVPGGGDLHADRGRSRGNLHGDQKFLVLCRGERPELGRAPLEEELGMPYSDGTVDKPLAGRSDSTQDRLKGETVRPEKDLSGPVGARPTVSRALTRCLFRSLAHGAGMTVCFVIPHVAE